jgi:hypothetical protein
VVLFAEKKIRFTENGTRANREAKAILTNTDTSEPLSHKDDPHLQLFSSFNNSNSISPEHNLSKNSKIHSFETFIGSLFHEIVIASPHGIMQLWSLNRFSPLLWDENDLFQTSFSPLQ